MNSLIKMHPALQLAFLVLVFIALLSTPLWIIWSLNILFPVLSIPYGFLQYMAVVLLMGFVSLKVTFKGDK